MTRLPDWRERLQEAEAPHLQAKFEWGVHDCVIRPADAILAITGVDLAEPFRGRYSSLGEARALLKGLGCKTTVDYVKRFLPQMRPIEARTGDLAVVDSGKAWPGGALGIVLSSRIAVYAPDGSASAVPLTAALKAFKVG